ncbi:carbohydrate-binding module family 50 protein [Aspergillus carbonarius ITEM 5010]|uniref:Carbohydrate-binding module family 50 protein n=1 Tax=Aspergillus carbonarius (strain ITEM 5010) TaxID=602072 RepID=A0A1R3R860_ASPC5|nr:carbohydrate-binding module family 50 protein [Aspergillus carbonarius ITEM 5010]
MLSHTANLAALTTALVIQAAALPSTVSYDTLPTTGSILNLAIPASNITHTVQPNETIFTIAHKYSIGACDLARLNVLADPNFIYVDEPLRIPSHPTLPSDTSCFSPNNTLTTNTCIPGGPHVYTILPGDTIQKIANERFNITAESILNQIAQTGYIAALNPGIYDVLETGETVKIPVCEDTVCTMTDFTFTYGTLQDFATQYGVIVGQIMALNLGYNHTEEVAPLGVLYDCQVVG